MSSNSNQNPMSSGPRKAPPPIVNRLLPPCSSLQEEEGASKKMKKMMISRDTADASSSGSSKEMLLQCEYELMGNLPTEVVADILLRLPVKQILLFRCVSKSLLALIDSPNFIKLHLNQSIKARNNRSLIVKVSPFFSFNQFSTYSINLDSIDVAVEIDLPLEVYDRERYAPPVVGSCNGLMLIRYDKCDARDVTTVVIWNPLTRKYLKLPNTRIESQHYLSPLETYGIGYDSICDDYKVVKMNQWGSEDGDGFYSEVKVYSLKSNTWRRIPDFPYYILFGRYGVFCGGALHWLVSDKFCESRFVAAFDLATEEYQLVPIPNFIGKYDFHNHVAVLEGCLCMCNHRKESVDVWVMKNYRVADSWIKLFSVSLPIDNTSYSWVTPLALSKDGTEVLYMHNREGHGLVWFDLERNTEKRIDVHGLRGNFSVEFVMQSLVSLGSGSKTYGRKQHREEQGVKV